MLGQPTSVSGLGSPNSADQFLSTGMKTRNFCQVELTSVSTKKVGEKVCVQPNAPDKLSDGNEVTFASLPVVGGPVLVALPMKVWAIRPSSIFRYVLSFSV